MSANRQPSQTTPGRPDAEVYKAARIYLVDHLELAVDFIARECDAKELLRAACEAKGDNFHRVISQHEDSNPDEDTRSQVSRRRTNSSNSRSEARSSSSVIFSSSGGTSDPSAAGSIWVSLEHASSPTPLKARRCSNSDYLIRA